MTTILCKTEPPGARPRQVCAYGCRVPCRRYLRNRILPCCDVLGLMVLHQGSRRRHAYAWCPIPLASTEHPQASRTTTMSKLGVGDGRISGSLPIVHAKRGKPTKSARGGGRTRRPSELVAFPSQRRVICFKECHVLAPQPTLRAVLLLLEDPGHSPFTHVLPDRSGGRSSSSSNRRASAASTRASAQASCVFPALGFCQRFVRRHRPQESHRDA
jgi:hypothetical protein